MANDPHYYHGRPCKRCGGTARSVERGDCMVCKSKRREKLEPINNPKFVEGRPCKHCGSTTRYASTRQCVKCIRERTRLKNQERDKALSEIEPRAVYDERCLGCGEYKGYFFLDYCHDCKKKQRKGWSRYIAKGIRCAGCGEIKHYSFKDYCRKCRATEIKRKEGNDYFKELHRIARNPF